MRLGRLIRGGASDCDVVGILDRVFRDSNGEGHGAVLSFGDLDRRRNVGNPAGRVLGAGNFEVNRVITSTLVVNQDVDGEGVLRVCPGVGQRRGHAELVVLVDRGNRRGGGVDVLVLILGANGNGGDVDIKGPVVLLFLNCNCKVHQRILASLDVNFGLVEVGGPEGGQGGHREADGVFTCTLVLDYDIVNYGAAGIAVLLGFVNQQVNLVFLVDRDSHRSGVVGVGGSLIRGAVNGNGIVAEVSFLIDADRQVDSSGLPCVEVNVLNNRAPVGLGALKGQVDRILAVALVLDRNHVRERIAGVAILGRIARNRDRNLEHLLDVQEDVAVGASASILGSGADSNRVAVLRQCPVRSGDAQRGLVTLASGEGEGRFRESSPGGVAAVEREGDIILAITFVSDVNRVGDLHVGLGRLGVSTNHLQLRLEVLQDRGARSVGLVDRRVFLR